MRVTGGILRGRTLKVPSGNVRPTQDMVREALFSIIAGRLEGARFLDLFAGSGAVGIDAWSRGVKDVCWVESDKKVLAVLSGNIESLCQGEGRIVRRDALLFVSKTSGGNQYDIIFADPPYGNQERDGVSGIADRLLAALVDADVWADGGLLVLEQAADDELTIPGELEIIKEKVYGGTRLRFIRKRETAEV